MKNQYDCDAELSEDILPQSRMQIKKEYRSRERRSWIISVLAAAAIALALRFFVFEFIRVDGSSMKPTLLDKEYVFMEKVTYWFRAPERGDIIICSFPESTESFVKRVIGSPGDRLKISDGVLYINGIPNYDYFQGIITNDMGEITVPDGCVFAMGDNRNASRDSRDPGVGPIPFGKILGKAEFIIWPLDNMHGI